MSEKVPKRLYGHMESIVRPVRHICPKTGEELKEPTEIPKEAVIQRYFDYQERLDRPLSDYRKKGVNNLTQEELNKAYRIIKGVYYAKQRNRLC